MKRKGFFLILTESPRAVDIVREDFIVSLNEETQKTSFRWEKSKDDFQVMDGTVLARGMKKDLSVLLVNQEGKISTDISKDEGLGTRRQEVEKERLRQARSQEINLQNQAELLLSAGGPELMLNQLQPVVRTKKRSSLPKKRDPRYLQTLSARLDNLPCFKTEKGDQKVPLLTGHKVYLDSAKLAMAKIAFGLKPLKHFKAIILACLPKAVILTDGISPTGKRGTVGIPEDLLSTILGYITTVYREKGGNINDINFNPNDKLKNLFNSIRKKNMKRSVAQPVPQHATQPATQPTPHVSQPVSPVTQPTQHVHQPVSPVMQHLEEPEAGCSKQYDDIPISEQAEEVIGEKGEESNDWNTYYKMMTTKKGGSDSLDCDGMDEDLDDDDGDGDNDDDDNPDDDYNADLDLGRFGFSKPDHSYVTLTKVLPSSQF